MDYTERISEIMCPLVSEHADSFGVGTHQSAWVDVSPYHRVFLFIDIGEVQKNGSVDWIDLHMATNVAGAGEDDVNVIDNGDVTTTGTYTTGDCLMCIEMRTEELERQGSYHWCSVIVEISGAAVELSYTLFGVSPRYPPVSQADWTEVVD